MTRRTAHRQSLGLQRLAAATALVVLSPVFALMYLAVRLTSRGQFLFTQQRRGLNGQPFTIYKVRTMTVGSEADSRLGTTASSPHVTAVGRVLRALKLDELPQLINIARGEMAIVGPRPVPEALHQHLSEHIPGFELRYAVRPGLTNVGQVSVADNAVGDGLIDDWRTRFEAELHYIGRRSLAYDAVVILMTGVFVLRRLCGGLRPTQSHQESNNSLTATRVLGAPIVNTNYRGVIGQIARNIRKSKPGYICILSVHSVMVGVWNRAHRGYLDRATLCTGDGMPLVWMQKLMGFRDASRVYGPTLMLKTLEEAQSRGWRVAFVGGKPERLEDLVQRMQERFPGLEIVDSISPPFRPLSPEEDEAMMQRLRDVQPDVIMVGLGCPKQERWMAEHHDRVNAVMLGVGAAFDFHAGAVPQSPPVLQRIGMEWAFRLAMEPRRLWKRYLTTNPPYVVLAGLQVASRWLLGRTYRIELTGRTGGAA